MRYAGRDITGNADLAESIAETCFRKEKELHGIENSRDVENMYHMRLMTLLRQLVRELRRPGPITPAPVRPGKTLMNRRMQGQWRRESSVEGDDAALVPRSRDP